ncbi:hypothetical protein L5515_015197 [Caenorhabditis briggsae]|uniref:ShKT domain-containing protein n=1 Tax=Caenorhabditis briggsae TaxID=6238 RepID=A0AAE9EFA8_CAEBR|nr:hypothetical protein L5515_015197 [Caenorhabditis briggsae]
MYKLLALLALISASGITAHSSPVSSETSSENKPPVAKSHPFQPGLPTASSGLFSSGSSFGLPTQTKTCRIRTVGRSINNVCPIGYTVITNGECCITPQVSTSGSTIFPPSTISPLPPFACADRSNTNGINECPRWRSYCTNVFYRDFMARNCPQTCGLCSSTTPSTCIDAVNPTTGRSECSANLGLCNNVAFRDWMKIQCPRTCGYCR